MLWVAFGAQHFLPSSVVHGFTMGVALIIAGGQLANALGLQQLPAQSRWFLTVYDVLRHLAEADLVAFALFSASWATLYGLVHRYPKVPWSVPITAVGICLGILSSDSRTFHLVTLRDRFGALTATLWLPPSLSTPAVAALLDRPREAAAATLSISFVAVLESLISGKVAAALTRTEMDSRREVLGLALGNLACGLAGGVPATAALARTALSIRSGATSRVAGVVCSALTAALSLFLLPLFAYLPLCVMAALLFQVAVGMMESRHLHDAYEVDVASFWLTLLVAVLCLLFDPTVAIVVGALCGLFVQAREAARGYSEVITNDDDDLVPSQPHTSVAFYRVVGDLNYLTSSTHVLRLQQLSGCAFIILSFRFCPHIDLDGLQQLTEKVHAMTAQQAGGERGQRLLVCAVQPQLQPALCHSDWYLRLLRDGCVFPSSAQAIDSLKDQLSARDYASLRYNVLEATPRTFHGAQPPDLPLH